MDRRWREHRDSEGAVARRDQLRRRLATVIRRDDFEIPSLPEVAVELQRLVESSSANSNDALKVVQRDAQLSARVMRLACSPALRGAAPTTSLRDAVWRIGLRGLRDVAFAAALEQTFARGPLASRARDEAAHAFAVACGTALVARTLQISQDYAFLCGLMHDVGRLALLAALGSLSPQEQRWLHPEFVDALLDDFHEEVGARVLERWNLPPLTHGVAARHHDIGIEDSPTNRMRNAVAISDAAADCGAEARADRLVRLQAHDATLALSMPDILLERLLDVVDSAAEALG